MIHSMHSQLRDLKHRNLSLMNSFRFVPRNLRFFLSASEIREKLTINYGKRTFIKPRDSSVLEYPDRQHRKGQQTAYKKSHRK